VTVPGEIAREEVSGFFQNRKWAIEIHEEPLPGFKNITTCMARSSRKEDDQIVRSDAEREMRNCLS